MNKCDRCLHGRTIVSENGLHSVCGLSAKIAIDCMTNRKSHLSIFYWKGDEYVSAFGEEAEKIFREEIEKIYQKGGE